ncbi:MAG: hypothetical protein N3A38_11560 [Planctomycetota bacterium]|nr:hypothetical protein [Planctomycetota bacterium]
MKRWLAVGCLCVAGAAYCAGACGEDLFRLRDGRRIEGSKVGESEGVVVIEVTCGAIRSRIQVPAADIESVTEVRRAEVGRVDKDKAGGGEPDAMRRDTGARIETGAGAGAEGKATPATEGKSDKKDEEAWKDREWERARKLLAAYMAGRRRPAVSGSALPYGMDPCEGINYDIYRRGALAEEFKGLQYWYGVLPGMTRSIWWDLIPPAMDGTYSRYVFDPYAVMYPVLDADGNPTGAWALRGDVAGPINIIAVRAEDMMLYQIYLQLLKDRAAGGLPPPGGGPTPAPPPATRRNTTWEPLCPEQNRINLLRIQGIYVPPPHPSMLSRR